MALRLYFQPSGFTPAVYHEVTKQLEQAGACFGKVPGRIFHCALEAGSYPGLRRVGVDGAVPEARETQLPIMSKLGADPGEPQIATVHNVQNG